LEEEIEGGEEFSSGGDEGDFEGFAVIAEALVEGFEDGIAAGGGESSHVEGATDGGTATGDVTGAGARAAVVVEGSQAGESGGALGVQGAEFWEMSQQSGGSGRANALEGAEAGGFGGEFWATGQQACEEGGDLEELFFEVADGGGEVFGYGLGQAWDLAGAFGAEHVLELIAAGDPGGQLLLQRARGRSG
jgi:hypothetical protein